MEKYAKIKSIGEGSFGKALLVRHKESGKQMVIKEINMNKMSRKEREEARKETAVLAQLHHPNVVMYRESFEEIGNLYIVMDYCDGGDLYGRINRQKGILFKEEEVLDWFVQCCLAIKHIHDRKILHRDIKSQNIFLTRHGIIKLGDFGIAKVLNSTVELARTCIGTPYYLSPEICENRPYNNKSDIWSLGCVLYELATLKHAFEAGNMKNLVLKIIRGSYPPPPPRYSYELRSLISALFKRSPRDRPSINTVLKKPLLTARIRKFLSESELAEEFSHTVMHGVKLQKQLPGGGRPLPPKPVLAKKAPSPAPQKYNPASVYAPSVARKSREARRSADSNVRKSSGSAGAKRPTPRVEESDIAKRRQELLEKERRRREEVRKEEAKKREQYAKQHQDIIDRQKANQINKAREEGWRNLIDSLSSTDESGEASNHAQGGGNAGGGGKYEHYHDWLSRKEAERKAGGDANQVPLAKPAQPRVPAATPMLGVAGALGWRQAPPQPESKPAAADVNRAAMMGQVAGAKGADAAEKARKLEEFQQRRREAALNKAKGQGDLYGKPAAVHQPPPAPKPSSGDPKPSAAGAAGKPKSAASRRPESARPAEPSAARHRPAVAGRPQSAREQRVREEEEYLARLRQIRLQNFNERRAVKEKIAGKPPSAAADVKRKSKDDLKNDPDLRRKKIEALRAQADERAKKLKEELERKRKEAYLSEQKKLQQAKAVQGPGMTEAMKAIGAVQKSVPPPEPVVPAVGMTAAMAAIGASADVSSSADKSPLQRKKEEILKRLNAKSPTKPEDAPPENVPEASKPAAAAKSERPRWGQPVKPAVEPAPADRPRWGDAGSMSALHKMSLEETASQMEATKAPAAESAAVVPPAEPVSARRQWGGPAGTVVNALQHADLTNTASTVKSDGSQDSAPTTPIGGGTVVLQKPAILHGLVQKEADGTKAPIVGSTITIESPSVAKKPGDEGDGNIAVSSAAPGNKIEAETIIEEDLPEDSEGTPTESSDNKPAANKPPVPTKPTIAAKPNVQKPNTEKADTDGEGGKVFEVVQTAKEEPKPDEDDMTLEEIGDDSDEEIKEHKKLVSSNGKVALGLTTGQFDVDVKILRTCSMPELSKLFCTNLAKNPFFDDEEDEEEDDDDEIAMSLDLEALKNQLEEIEKKASDDEIDDEESKDDDIKVSFSLSGDEDDDEGKDKSLTNSSNKSEGSKDSEAQDDVQNEGDDVDEEDEDDDDEDLQTLRESMMSILQQDDPASDDELSSTKKKKVKKAKKGKKPKKKKSTTDEPDAPRGVGRQWSDGSVEDFNTMREAMKSLLQTEQDEKAAPAPLAPVLEHGAGGDALAKVELGCTLDPNTESWQDDGDDDYFEEEDMFSRLEESRAKLETELGCDTFLQAYKTVQAIHEDEDENIEDGITAISQILGQAHMHLYPSILQLVMADGAFTEDND